MKFILIGLGLLFAVSAPAGSLDKKADMAAFKTAYAAYQDAVANERDRKWAPYAEAVLLAGEKIFPETHPNILQLRYNYAEALYFSRDFKAALAEIKALKKSLDTVDDEGGELMIDSLLLEARVRPYLGRGAAAVTSANLAVDRAKDLAGPEHLYVGMTQLEAGRIFVDIMLKAIAEDYLDAAKVIFEKHGDTGRTAMADLYLGKYYRLKKNYRKAVNYFEASVEPLEAGAPAAQITLGNHAFLVELYSKLGQPDEATEHCQAIGRLQPGLTNREMKPLYLPPAKYPYYAQLHGEGGSVLVELSVDEQGFTRDIQVLETEGRKSFEKAAIKAVEKYRFAARYENGKPVVTTGVKYKVMFQFSN